jgi:hypothetical protein
VGYRLELWELRRIQEQLPALGVPVNGRSSDRFPIRRDVRYKVLDRKTYSEMGTGETINISSSGVLFSTEQPLELGTSVRLSISWPLRLDNKCGLTLVAKGKVVRCQGHLVAVSIESHEFRTQGSKSLPVRAAGSAVGRPTRSRQVVRQIR